MNEQLIVGKYGSACVADRCGGLKQERLEYYAAQWAPVHRSRGAILVTSGAAWTGEALWRRHAGNDFEESTQPFAMIGNPVVMNAWRKAFQKQQVVTGEFLVTKHELEDRRFPKSEGNVAHGVLENNLAHGIMTMVNYNDALDPSEVERLDRWGDNDYHALRIATFMGAGTLYLPTETDGLHTRSGIIHTIKANEHDWQRAQRWAGPSNEGRVGGMESKVQVAIEAAKLGIEAFIAPATASVQGVINRDVAATYFEPVRAA